MPAGKSAKALAETAPPAEIQALLNLLLADPKVQVRLAIRVEPERETPGIRAPTCAMPTTRQARPPRRSRGRGRRAATPAIASSSSVTMQATPTTTRLRSGEPQVLGV